MGGLSCPAPSIDGRASGAAWGERVRMEVLGGRSREGSKMRPRKVTPYYSAVPDTPDIIKHIMV